MNNLHVVNLSLDPQVLHPTSVTAERVRRYGAQIASYTIFVPSNAAETVVLSPNVTAIGVSGFTKVGILFAIYRRLRALVAAGACDVISADQYYFGALACYFGWRFGVGVEVAALGFEKLTCWRRMVARFVLRRADVIRINGSYMADFLRTQFGIADSRVRTVPIYIDTSSLGLNRTLTQAEAATCEQHRAAFQQEFGGNFNFLTVSRLVPVKNIALQLRAVATLRATYPQLHLHVVGDGPEKNALESMIAELGIAAHVTLHGRITGLQLGVLYKQADCFLLTSTSEGWGMVLIEAMTAGLPIIMTKVGAAGDIVISGQHGIVLDTPDSADLMSAMEKLMTNEAFRQQAAEHARQAVRQLPSAMELVSLYTEVWVEALRHRRGIQE